MLAVEASRHHKMRVIAHPDVMKRIQRHRIHELKSTGMSESTSRQTRKHTSKSAPGVQSELKCKCLTRCSCVMP